MDDSKELDFKASVSLDKRINRGSDGTVGTAATIESDWESHLIDPTPSLSPWPLYLAFRNAKILTVEPVVFLYMFGVYLSFPLLQQYYLNRYALDVLRNTAYPHANETRCIDKEMVTNYTGDNTTYGQSVEKNATLLFIYHSLAGQLLAIIATIIMGPISDRYGRRPVIIIVALGAGLQGLFNFLIIEFDLNLYFFILSGFIGGVFGGFAAILMACFSYISDITSGKWRTLRIGLAESMIFLAGLLSQGLGELWFQKLDCDIVPPLYLYIACNVAIIIYTVVLLPESLNSEERKRKNAGKPRGVKSLLRGAAIFFCQVKEYSVWKIWVALVPVVIITIIMGAETSVGVFFFTTLKWKPALIGAYQATSMGSHMVGLMVLLPILVALKLPDPLITLIGVLFNCAMNLFLGLSTHVYEVFIVGVVQGVDAIMVSPLRSYMSKGVHVEDQGALFSVIASLESLASMVSIAYTFILPKLLAYGLRPGTTFIIIACLGLISIPFLSCLLIGWCKTKFSVQPGRPLNYHQVGQEDSEKTPILRPDNSTTQY